MGTFLRAVRGRVVARREITIWKLPSDSYIIMQTQPPHNFWKNNTFAACLSSSGFHIRGIATKNKSISVHSGEFSVARGSGVSVWERQRAPGKKRIIKTKSFTLFYGMLNAEAT